MHPSSTGSRAFALAMLLLVLGGFAPELRAQRGGLAFDGNDYARAADSDALDLGDESLTVEAWIKHDGESAPNAVIVTKRAGDSVDYELSLVGEGEEVPVRFVIYSDGYQVVSSVGVPAGVWTHVAGTYDGANVTVYVNGMLSGQLQTSGPTLAVEAPLYVGGEAETGERGFSGLLDEVRVWDEVRTLAALRGSMLVALTGSPTGLAAYYPFTNGGNDAAGTSHLTLEGAAVVSPGIFPVPPHLFATAGQGSVSLRWSPLVGAGNANLAAEYRLYRSTQPDGGDRQRIATPGAAAFTYTDAGLTDGTTYFYEITTVDALGNESDYSAAPSATPFRALGGGALRLDGDGFGRLSDRPSVSNGDEGVTVEAWIKHDGESAPNAVIVTKRAGDSVDYELSLVGEGEEVPVRFAIYGDSWNATSSVGVPAGVWTHVAGAYNGLTVSVFVNGQLVGQSETSGATLAVEAPLYVGGEAETGERGFSGLLDEVRVWDLSRSLFEIREARHLLLEGGTIGLMAYFRFDDVGSPVGRGSELGSATLELVEGTIVAGGALPEAPLLVARPAAQSATLVWSARAEGRASGFEVYRSTSAAGAGRQLVATLDASATSYTDAGLTDGTTYFYEVVTVETNGQESAYSQQASVTPAAKADGNALRLDGDGDYAVVTDRPTLDMGDETLTVEAWIQHDGTSDADAVIVSKRDVDAVDYELSLVGEGQEVPVRFTIYGDSWSAVSGVNVAAGAWTHVAGVYDGTNVRIYVNGTLSGTASSSGATLEVDRPLAIGADLVTESRFFDGLIDEVRIWTSARTTNEIGQAHRGVLFGNEDDLAAYFRFDEVAGDTARGSALHPMTARLGGDASFTVSGSPVPNEDAGPAVPERFTLEGNFPNPFNPRTVIRYGLPRAAAVRVAVYDATGRRIAELLGGVQQPAGWHEVAFEGAHLSSGIYFYRVEAGGFTRTGRMVLVK